MTNISRSTASIQANPLVLGLFLAALRLGLIVEGPPTLPFPKAKQIMPELFENSSDLGIIEEVRPTALQHCGPLTSESGRTQNVEH